MKVRLLIDLMNMVPVTRETIEVDIDLPDDISFPAAIDLAIETARRQGRIRPGDIPDVRVALSEPKKSGPATNDAKPGELSLGAQEIAELTPANLPSVLGSEIDEQTIRLMHEAHRKATGQTPPAPDEG